MNFNRIRRLAVIVAAGSAAMAIQPVSYAQASGEIPSACHGFYSHVPDGYHPLSTKKFDSFPFSVEVQSHAVKIVWLDMVTEYVERQPSIGEIVTGYDDWSFGNFRILCGDKGSVVLVADKKGEGVQTLKLFRSTGNIFAVAEQRGWPMAE